MSLKQRLDPISFVETKIFWLLLALVVALPLLGLVDFAGSDHLVGDVAIQNIAYVQAGREFDIGVRESQGEMIGVQMITLTLGETIKNGQVRVEEDASIPFDREYYSKFIVSSSDAAKISQIKFQLKIKEEDLLRKGIARYDVRLYHNGQEQITALIEKEGDYVYYSATANGLGQFVIGRVAPAKGDEITTVKEAVVQEEPTVSETEQPAAGLPENMAGEATGEVKASLWKKFRDFLARFLG